MNKGKTDEAERNVKLRDEKQSAMQVTSFSAVPWIPVNADRLKGLVFLESDRKKATNIGQIVQGGSQHYFRTHRTLGSGPINLH